MNFLLKEAIIDSVRLSIIFSVKNRGYIYDTVNREMRDAILHSINTPIHHVVDAYLIRRRT